jgi:hypothetical protein
MAVKVEVRAPDPVVKARREAAAQRVMQAFEGKLPNLKLLAFFDDEDQADFRRKQGLANRGLYRPIKEDGPIGAWPLRMTELIFVLVDEPPGWCTRRVYDHGIYLHGSTCADDTALAMTFAHELQHFVQYGSKRKLWAESRLIRELPRKVQEKEKLNWPDIPHEREARIRAKWIGVRLCGEDAVKQYLDHLIKEAGKRCIDQMTSETETEMEIEDLRFSRALDSSLPYDLASGVKQIYQRMRPYREELEDALQQMKTKRSPDFRDEYRDIDLSDYFDC